MLLIALAAAAGQLSAPRPNSLRAWFSYEDVPEFLTRRGNGLWFVGIRLTVDPAGVIRSCSIDATSGIAELDSLTCRLAHQRAHFAPAHLADGSAAWGVYRTSVKWLVADSPWDASQISHPDLDVSVQALPAGVKSPTLVRLMFSVDADGHISSCTAEPTPSFERAENNAQLIPIACDQLSKNYKAIPARDLNGRAVPSVQDAVVRFSAAQR